MERWRISGLLELPPLGTAPALLTLWAPTSSGSRPGDPLLERLRGRDERRGWPYSFAIADSFAGDTSWESTPASVGADGPLPEVHCAPNPGRSEAATAAAFDRAFG